LTFRKHLKSERDNNKPKCSALVKILNMLRMLARLSATAAAVLWASITDPILRLSDCVSIRESNLIKLDFMCRIGSAIWGLDDHDEVRLIKWPNCRRAYHSATTSQKLSQSAGVMSFLSATRLYYDEHGNRPAININ